MANWFPSPNRAPSSPRLDYSAWLAIVNGADASKRATATNFFKVAGANEIALQPTMSARAVARIGYRALKSGRRVVITGMLNNILAIGARLAPHSITLPAASALMSRR